MSNNNPENTDERPDAQSPRKQELQQTMTWKDRILISHLLAVGMVGYAGYHALKSASEGEGMTRVAHPMLTDSAKRDKREDAEKDPCEVYHEGMGVITRSGWNTNPHCYTMPLPPGTKINEWRWPVPESYAAMSQEEWERRTARRAADETPDKWHQVWRANEYCAPLIRDAGKIQHALTGQFPIQNNYLLEYRSGILDRLKQYIQRKYDRVLSGDTIVEEGGGSLRSNENQQERNRQNPEAAASEKSGMHEAGCAIDYWTHLDSGVIMWDQGFLCGNRAFLLLKDGKADVNHCTQRWSVPKTLVWKKGKGQVWIPQDEWEENVTTVVKKWLDKNQVDDKALKWLLHESMYLRFVYARKGDAVGQNITNDVHQIILQAHAAAGVGSAAKTKKDLKWPQDFESFDKALHALFDGGEAYNEQNRRTSYEQWSRFEKYCNTGAFGTPEAFTARIEGGHCNNLEKVLRDKRFAYQRPVYKGNEWHYDSEKAERQVVKFKKKRSGK
jgi:hypothetical protein